MSSEVRLNQKSKVKHSFVSFPKFFCKNCQRFFISIDESEKIQRSRCIICGGISYLK